METEHAAAMEEMKVSMEEMKVAILKELAANMLKE